MITKYHILKQNKTKQRVQTRLEQIQSNICVVVSFVRTNFAKVILPPREEVDLAGLGILLFTL